jgi:hypothetical protein
MKTQRKMMVARLGAQREVSAQAPAWRRALTYSGDNDSARMIHVFHTTASAVGANVWLEYVQSGANIADLPSRGEFALLHSLGSIRFEIVLPQIGGEWTEVFSSIFRDFAPRPSAGVKRARAQISEEVARLRRRLV